jgi:hypothetical protein
MVMAAVGGLAANRTEYHRDMNLRRRGHEFKKKP